MSIGIYVVSLLALSNAVRIGFALLPSPAPISITVIFCGM